MRVTLHRHGGFAAIPALDVRVCLDSAALPLPDAAELTEAVRRAGLDDLAGREPSPVRPDARIYELAVEDDAAVVRARVSDPLPSPQLRDLIDLLLARGSPVP